MNQQSTLDRTSATGDRHDLVASNRVEGTAVFARDGDKIGTIKHFMVGKRSGKVEYAVMSCGGFLGMGEEHRPVPWNALDYDTDKGGFVLKLDRDRIKDSPSYRADNEPDWGPDYGRQVFSYYNIAY